jgi:hypothetical protein
MRIGLIGPALNAKPKLERALELLGGDGAMRQIIYLGGDDAAGEVVAARARGGLDADTFLRRAAELAPRGTADEIVQLLAEERNTSRLGLIRRLPEPPARAIEMMDKWIVLAVHDKAVLDEDDISNAHIIVYGRADEASLDRFGPRCFFTPGPLAQDRIGCLELMPYGHIEIRLLALDGSVQWSEPLYASGAKLVVTS